MWLNENVYCQEVVQNQKIIKKKKKKVDMIMENYVDANQCLII